MQINFQLNKFEINRQLFHVLLGVAIVVLLMFGVLNEVIMLILICIGIILSYASRYAKIPIVYYLLKKFEREKEINYFPGKGIIFYLIGSYISLLIFEKEIAMASIMVLALGDSFSHLYGIHYGKTKNPFSKTKFLEGTIAGLIAGFIGALIFLPWYEAFFAASAAMFFEAIEIKIGASQVDDNLIIPIVAGFSVWILRFFSF